MSENSKVITVDLNKPLRTESLVRLAALDSRPIDYSDIPPLPDTWLKELAHRPHPENKKPVSIPIEAKSLNRHTNLVAETLYARALQ